MNVGNMTAEKKLIEPQIQNLQNRVLDQNSAVCEFAFKEHTAFSQLQVTNVATACCVQVLKLTAKAH